MLHHLILHKLLLLIVLKTVVQVVLRIIQLLYAIVDSTSRSLFEDVIASTLDSCVLCSACVSQSLMRERSLLLQVSLLAISQLVTSSEALVQALAQILACCVLRGNWPLHYQRSVCIECSIGILLIGVRVSSVDQVYLADLLVLSILILIRHVQCHLIHLRRQIHLEIVHSWLRWLLKSVTLSLANSC